MSARPRGTDSARVIQVIETKALRGKGENEEDMCRNVTQYWSLDGEFLVENDPYETEIKLENSLRTKDTVHEIQPLQDNTSESVKVIKVGDIVVYGEIKALVLDEETRSGLKVFHVFNENGCVETVQRSHLIKTGAMSYLKDILEELRY